MGKLSNEELVERVVKTITSEGSLTGDVGKLNDAQADQFIDFVFDESILPSVARIVRFRNEEMKIDKIGVGKRVAVRKREARDPGVRRGVKHSQVNLKPEEIMVPFEISDIYREVNLEGENVEEKIIRLFARQTNNDAEEAYIHGNTTGYMALEADVLPEGGSQTEYVIDDYLTIFDGLLKKAEAGNVIDLGGQPVSSNVFSRMLNAMPTKFKKMRNRLRWLVAVELEQNWRERLSTRATAMGDQALSSNQPIMPFGIPMVPVPLMQFYPPQVQVTSFTGSGSTIQLDNSPVQPGSVVVVANADADVEVPIDAYVDPTDYTVDETAGTVTHAGGGSAIGATEEVRITYGAFPRIILTHLDNIIIAFGRDIRLERDRDIYKGVNQFALTAKIDTQIEELDAMVLGTNVGDSV